MYSRSSSRSAMAPLGNSQSETQPLLSPLETPTLRERFAQASFVPRQLCLPSKAAILILLWSGIVGATFTLALDATVAVGVSLNVNKHSHLNSIVLVNVLVPYVLLAVAMLLYPISGFMADVCCGRYKSVMISLCILICSLVCFTICCTASAVDQIGILHSLTDQLPYKIGRDIVIVLFGIAFLLLFIGLSGFQANFIQLGLDQLLEAPSEYLGLFVHWAMWAGCISAPGLNIMFAVYGCNQRNKVLYGLFSLPIICLVLLSVILVFSFRKRHWFYVEPGQHNPYKMVVNVLIFAWKHSHPLRRSAFTFHGGEMPNRIDFAKERYGGPFLTEQVEDVKTFFRILMVLIALGPIFILEVPTSYFIFPIFTLHTGFGSTFHNRRCTGRWLILESGTLGYIFAAMAFPVYIWLIYTFLRRCIPRTFYRLFIGGGLLFISVVFMLVTDLVGHMQFKEEYARGNESMASSFCMFKLNVSSSNATALHLPWEVHLIPNILVNFSTMLVTTTAFEFISAQSPHSMKGLIVGVFYTIKGVFQLLSAFLLLPFSLPSYWTLKSAKEVNCGFGYLFIVTGLALIGLIFFSAVAKRYQYRERDDPPFDQMAVEEVFARNISQNTYPVYSPEEQNMEYSFLDSQ